MLTLFLLKEQSLTLEKEAATIVVYAKSIVRHHSYLGDFFACCIRSTHQKKTRTSAIEKRPNYGKRTRRKHPRVFFKWAPLQLFFFLKSSVENILIFPVLKLEAALEFCSTSRSSFKYIKLFSEKSRNQFRSAKSV